MSAPDISSGPNHSACLLLLSTVSDSCLAVLVLVGAAQAQRFRMPKSVPSSRCDGRCGPFKQPARLRANEHALDAARPASPFFRPTWSPTPQSPVSRPAAAGPQRQQALQSHLKAELCSADRCRELRSWTAPYLARPLKRRVDVATLHLRSGGNGFQDNNWGCPEQRDMLILGNSW